MTELETETNRAKTINRIFWRAAIIALLSLNAVNFTFHIVNYFDRQEKYQNIEQKIEEIKRDSGKIETPRVKQVIDQAQTFSVSLLDSHKIGLPVTTKN